MFDRLEDILIAAKENIFKSKIKKALFFIVVFCFLFNGGCKVMRRMNSDVIYSKLSPDGMYTLTAYIQDAKPTVDYSVYAKVRVTMLPFLSREIYWKYHEESCDIRWIDNYTVEVNGIELNIFFDKYR